MVEEYFLSNSQCSLNGRWTSRSLQKRYGLGSLSSAKLRPGSGSPEAAPKEAGSPQRRLKQSCNQGVKRPGFSEPHPTPQRREEVAENQSWCEPLRIPRMSHFPGGWEGLVGGRRAVEVGRTEMWSFLSPTRAVTVHLEEVMLSLGFEILS